MSNPLPTHRHELIDLCVSRLCILLENQPDNNIAAMAKRLGEDEWVKVAEAANAQPVKPAGKSFFNTTPNKES